MANAILVQPLVPASIGIPSGGEAAGAPAVNMLNDFVGMVWRSTATSGAVVIDLDLGTAAAIDTVALLSHANASAGAGFQIWAASSAGNLGISGYAAGSFAMAAGASVPSSGRQNGFADLGAVQSWRYWRIQINSIAGAFELGRLVLGRKVSFGRNFDFGGFARGVRDLGSVDFTPSGGLLRRTAAKIRRLNISWSNVTAAELEGALLPLLETAGSTSPLLIVTDPAANAELSRRMYFGFLTSDLDAPIRAFDAYIWRASLASVV